MAVRIAGGVSRQSIGWGLRTGSVHHNGDLRDAFLEVPQGSGHHRQAQDLADQHQPYHCAKSKSWQPPSRIRGLDSAPWCFIPGRLARVFAHTHRCRYVPPGKPSPPITECGELKFPLGTRRLEGAFLAFVADHTRIILVISRADGAVPVQRLIHIVGMAEERNRRGKPVQPTGTTGNVTWDGWPGSW